MKLCELIRVLEMFQNACAISFALAGHSIVSLRISVSEGGKLLSFLCNWDLGIFIFQRALARQWLDLEKSSLYQNLGTCI